MQFFGRFVRLLISIMLASLLCTACMVGPDFHSPAAPKTKTYTRSPLKAKTVSTNYSGSVGKAQVFAKGRDLPAEWWQLFHSRALNELVLRGLANSPNVEAAEATLRQAQETLAAQIGTSLYPSLSFQATINRQAFSNAGFGVGGRQTFNFYNPAFNLSYTLDVFGGLRRQIEALGAQVDYQAFQREAAYLNLSANIIRAAVNSAALQEQIRATRELINAQEESFRIVEEQLNLGGASGADVLAQASQVAQTRASLPPLEKSYAQSQHLLAVLIGSLPSEARLPSLDLNDLTLPKSLPLSLPSSLVRQRPDILASEALLHAASAQVGVATANLYPQFTITGSYGWAQDHPANLFTADNSVWSIGLQLAQPIFNGGALRAQRRAAVAAFEKAAAQYRQTVLGGFQNVADSLKAIEDDARTFRAQRQAELAAKSSLELTRGQYRLGGLSYLSLLNAERQYQQARLGRIQAQAARYNDTVALFQALGGGWWNRGCNGLSTTKK